MEHDQRVDAELRVRIQLTLKTGTDPEAIAPMTAALQEIITQGLWTANAC